MTDLTMINEIHILHHSKRCDFGGSPGEKPSRLLSVVSYHHELVVELREESFDSFSEFLVCPCRRLPILLVQPIRYFQGYVCYLEKILLYLCTEIPFVSKHYAIVILPLHIFEIMEIMNVGNSHVIRMDNPTYTTDSVELITIIMHALRGAIAPLRCAFIIIPAHCTAFCSGVLTNLDRFGVNAEHIFITIHCHCYVFAYFLAKNGRELSTLIVFAPTNQIGKTPTPFLGIEPLEKAIFAIKTKSLSRGRKRDDFQIGKLGNNATMRAIMVCCIIARKTLRRIVKRLLLTFTLDRDGISRK